MNLWKSLKGWKTYIGFAAYAVLGVALAQGWIDQNTYDTALPIIVAWTGVAARDALKQPVP